MMETSIYILDILCKLMQGYVKKIQNKRAYYKKSFDEKVDFQRLKKKNGSDSVNETQDIGL